MLGAVAVLKRNLLYSRKTLLQTFFWAAFEPILYLVAIGFALGKAVGPVDGVEYSRFYLPALLASTAMTVPFMESTFGAFTKMRHQMTYSTILLAPVTSAEIVMGEIFYGAIRGALGFVCVAIVGILFGVMSVNTLIPALLVLFLIALMFSSLGLLTVSFARNYDSFTYAISGVIVPMSLFGGTYFPLSQMPQTVQTIAWFLPLTHGVTLVRAIVLEKENPIWWANLLVILFVTVGSGYWAARRIANKLEH